MLSTIQHDQEFEKCLRKQKKEDCTKAELEAIRKVMVQDWGKYAQIEVPRPPEIATYNLDGMGGVDQGDQITQNIGAKRRTRDWSSATFWGLIEVVLMDMIMLWCSYDSERAGQKTYKQWAGEMGKRGLEWAKQLEKKCIAEFESKVKAGKANPLERPFRIFKKRTCHPKGDKGEIEKYCGLVSQNNHKCTICGARRAQYHCKKCGKWACFDHIFVH